MVFNGYEWNDLPVLTRELLNSDPVHRGEWQAMDVSMSKMHATYELTDVTLVLPEIPATQGELAVLVQPDLPWAEEHFGERVSGVPYNPAPSHVRWPYAVRGNTDHTRCGTCGSRQPSMHPAVSGGGEVTRKCPDAFHLGVPSGFKFDHTYPERFWPKHAYGNSWPEGEIDSSFPMRGIRYEYGDLADVVAMLARNPLTRQAYLPVWFPEDTGAGAGKRVPCTLGYHFMADVEGRLTCRYYIRSCDMYRHLVNDVYLAARLTQWVCQQANLQLESRVHLFPGSVIMHISSLHAFVGDVRRIERKFLGE